MLELVKSTTKADLFFVRQAYPKGLGDAILQAKSFIGDEAFVVMLGDNILESDVPVTKQLLDLYEVNGAANLAVIDVPQAETDQYGIIEIDQAVEGFDGDVFSLLGVVEKTESGGGAESVRDCGSLCVNTANFRYSRKASTG